MKDKFFETQINGLRAIAVLSVVFYHFHMMSVDSGFVGVDIFFVISGYLMTQVLMKSNSDTSWTSIKSFYINRVRRIVPALAFVIIITVTLLLHKLLYSDMLWVMRSAISSSLFFSNYYYQMVQGYFDPAAETNPFIHTWSLSVEWQFYIFYPWLILLAKKFCNVENISRIIRVILMSSFLYCSIQTDYLHSDVYYDSLVRVWEFLCGATVAMENNWFEKNIDGKKWVVWFLFPIFIYSILFIDKTKFPGLQSTLPVLFAMLVIANKKGVVFNLMSNRVLQFFGNISYSLYLWHWVIYVYIATVLIETYYFNFIDKLIISVVSIFVSYLTYRYVESPIRNRFGFWKNSKVILLWVALLIYVLSVTFFVVSTKNTDIRLPVYLNRIESSSKDINPNQSKCFLQSDEVKTRGALPKFCIFGAKIDLPPTVFLWGDSFADALQPAITESLINLRKKGVAATAAGCAPMPISGYSKDDKRDKEFDYCGREFGKEAFQYIKSNPSIEYVILVANWSRYDSKLVAENFKKEICKLKEIGKKVILFGQVPMPGYDVPKHWAKMQLNAGGEVNDVYFSTDFSNLYVEKSKEIVGNVKNECGDFIYYDPVPKLCNFGKCTSVHKGIGYYWDSSHLTKSGAMLFKDDFSSLLSSSSK